MTSMMPPRVDFDDCAETARSDPRRFAAERERLITAQIARSLDPDKIAAYQLQIDSMRLEKPPGVDAYHRLATEMYYQLEALMRIFEQLKKELDAISRKP